MRAVDVQAPAGTVFRWLCQLKAAPYSYDLLDNRGRRSPRTLTPGLDRLEIGEPFLVFRLVAFEVDRHLTGVALPGPEKLFGPIAITYAVRPAGAGSRLMCAMAWGRSGPLGGLRRTALACGDLVMMRKQLLNLKGLAEMVPAGQHNPDRLSRRASPAIPLVLPCAAGIPDEVVADSWFPWRLRTRRHRLIWRGPGTRRRAPSGSS